jgi:formylglycine-generating enzyme required for sulfatase activity
MQTRVFIVAAAFATIGCSVDWSLHDAADDDATGADDFAGADADADAEDDGGVEDGGDVGDDGAWEADVACLPDTCPTGMIYIPCGMFVMGSDLGEGYAEERPERVVALSAYCIDQSEVTVFDYEACGDPGCTAPRNPSDPGNYPVGLDWNQASAYCEWANKQLPTEAQWEKAARGGCELESPDGCGPEDERTYPWGEETPTCEFANHDHSDPTGPSCGSGVVAVDGLRPRGDSPYGVRDMAGNVEEWVRDWLDERYYSSCLVECTDPLGATTGEYRVMRGGGYTRYDSDLTVSRRTPRTPTSGGLNTGVRCSKDLWRSTGRGASANLFASSW